MKGGNNDGLICGGRSSIASVFQDRWVSDNTFALIAMKKYGWHTQGNKIRDGINNILKNNSQNCWYQRVDKYGNKFMGTWGWINFAPANFNARVYGASYPSGLADEIHHKLQL